MTTVHAALVETHVHAQAIRERTRKRAEKEARHVDVTQHRNALIDAILHAAIVSAAPDMKRMRKVMHRGHAKEEQARKASPPAIVPPVRMHDVLKRAAEMMMAKGH